MKKLLAILVCITMLCVGTAHAQGLGGLGISGGLDGLRPLIVEPDPPKSETEGILWDPAEELGDTKTTLARDYAFAMDYICTAYSYPLAKDPAAFAETYSARAAADGFTVETIDVEGNTALKLSYEDKYALLFPSFNGVTMLLVQNDMAFGEPKPEGYYLSFDYNGQTYSTLKNRGKITPSCKNQHHSIIDDFVLGYTSPASYRMIVETYFDYFNKDKISVSLSFPDYAEQGSEYRVSYTEYVKDFCFSFDGESYVLLNDSNELKNKNDFFYLRITKVEKEGTSTVYEGEFEGSFNNGKEVFSNGEFRVYYNGIPISSYQNPIFVH